MNSDSHSPATDVDTDRSRTGRPELNSGDATTEDTTTDDTAPKDTTTDAQARTPLGALAVLASGAAFYRLLGVPGILAGIVLAVCWYWSSAEATFAFGTLLLVVAVPENPPIEGVALVEGGLLAVLVSTLRQYDAPANLLGVFLVFLAGLLAAAWIGVEYGGAVWIGALVLIVTVSLLAYGQHRYALVATGLVESKEERTR
jgi:hypothetical protein